MSREIRNSKSAIRNPEQQLLRAFWAIVRSENIPEESAYRLASEAIGRPLKPGFGLSTCSKPELIRIVDHLKRHVGQEPGPHRPGPKTKEYVLKADPIKVHQLASQEQRDLAISLAIEVFGRDFTRDGPFASFLYRMTRRRELRHLTHQEMGRLIEALKQMQARGWRPSTVQGS